MLTSDETSLAYPMPSSFISPYFIPSCSACVIAQATWCTLSPKTDSAATGL